MRSAVIEHFASGFAEYLQQGTAYVAPRSDLAAAIASSRVVRLTNLPNAGPGVAAVALFAGAGSVQPPNPDSELPPFPYPAEVGDAWDEVLRDKDAERAGIPEHSDEGDRAAWEQRMRRARTRRLNAEVTAFYQPYTSLDGADAGYEASRDDADCPDEARPWGIVLLAAGIEGIAWDLAERGVPAQFAMQIAGAYLLGHEYGHYLVDVALFENDRFRSEESRRAEPGPLLARRHHAAGFAPEEESWCEAYSIEQARLAAQALLESGAATDLGAVATIVKERVADGLPGYSNGADIDDLQGSFVELLRSIGAVDPERSALLADIGCTTPTTRLNSVEVALGVSRGSRHAAGEWTTAHI